MKIERYPVYKDSGIEWLGEVPSHWALSRIKSLTKTKSGTTPKSGTNEYYEKGTHFWIRTTDLNNDRLFSSEFKLTDLAIKDSGLTFIQPKSVLLAMYGGMGTIGKNSLLEVEATINQSVCAIFRNNKNFNSVYLWYYLQFFRPHWEIFADSARKDPNINQEAIKRLWVTIPPLPEQKAIAHYLDTKTAQIDRKIDLLTQKAKLYGNLKQSLINETVTRGLDKTVPMKDSGVEWLGEVPEHWQVNKLSQSFSQIGSGTTPKSGSETYYEDGTINWINTGDLNDSIISECKRKVTLQALKDHSLKVYRPGSIVIAMYGATIGKVSILNIEACTNQACCVLNKSKILNVKFMFYWFIAQRNFIISLSYGGGQPNISQDTVKSLRVYAPSFSEQKAIAHYLDTKTAQIDKIIQTINTQIEKLKELRKTLINDVVTGKIKV